MFKIISCNFRGKHEGGRGQLERVQNIPLSSGVSEAIEVLY